MYLYDIQTCFWFVLILLSYVVGFYIDNTDSCTRKVRNLICVHMHFLADKSVRVLSFLEASVHISVTSGDEEAEGVQFTCIHVSFLRQRSPN